MKVLPNNLSQDELNHVTRLLELLGGYSKEHIPPNSRVPVSQVLILSIQGGILSKLDHTAAMYVARHITRMRPHPDEVMRETIDKVLSGEAEKMFAILENQLNPSTTQ